MTSTQPCRLHEWMTEGGELKTGLECPTLGLSTKTLGLTGRRCQDPMGCYPTNSLAIRLALPFGINRYHREQLVVNDHL